MLFLLFIRHSISKFTIDLLLVFLLIKFLKQNQYIIFRACHLALNLFVISGRIVAVCIGIELTSDVIFGRSKYEANEVLPLVQDVD